VVDRLAYQNFHRPTDKSGFEFRDLTTDYLV